MITVEVKNKLFLRGLIEEDCDIIEKDLTFKNPKYEKIKKYSKWSTTSEPKFLQYFKLYEEKGVMCAEVPVGYSLEHLKSAVYDVTDHRKLGICSFPEFLLSLRETQKEALDAYTFRNCTIHTFNHLCGSVQLPTGKGKTVLGLALAHNLSCRTLIIVHKVDLVKGWKADIEKCFGGKADVGIIQSKSRKIGNHFTIATIQTLNTLPEETLNTLYNTFGLVIQDEMHHCPSTSFQIGNNFNCRFRLGLTATPERSDGLEHIMTLFYGDFCYKYKYTKEDEDILQVEVLKREVPTYFNPIMSKSGDRYRLKDLTYKGNFKPNYVLTNKEKRITDLPYYSRPEIPHFNIDYLVVKEESTITMVMNDILFEYNQGRSCIVFFTQKEHLEIYYNRLLELGVNSNNIGLYYGNNKNCDSVTELAEKQRQFITLATYSKATEGTNVKQWEVGFFVSSINNGKNVEQAVGRIRRTKEGKKLKVAKLYDYRYSNVYQLNRHGDTRDTRYKKLHLKFSGSSKSRKNLFSRGFS